MLFSNCSLSFPSCSLQLHSAAFIWSLPIQSCADSFSFLCNLQYCSDSIISLCCSLNFSFSTLNNLVVLLHVSFSALVSVCINCKPFHFFIMGTYSLSMRSYTFDGRAFAASISKLNRSTYLSGNFQH